MIQDVIEKKLSDEFQPEFLKVINESDMHNVPRGSESHFKVTVVSERCRACVLSLVIVWSIKPWRMS